MPCSFLIVDADRNFREALAIALRLDGYDVAVAETAEDGIRRLPRAAGGCCLVDAHLEGAEALLDAAARAGVRLVMTGPYPDLLAQLARRRTGVELLPKPFRVAELTCCSGGNAHAPDGIDDRVRSPG
jgi:DNA-binding NtrC family response regulator